MLHLFHRIVKKYKQDGGRATYQSIMKNIRIHYYTTFHNLSIKEARYKIRSKDDVKGYEKPILYSKLYYGLMVEHASTSRGDISILEIGSGAGRHLAYFHKQGERDLNGIELTPNAVELFEQTWPDVARDAQIEIGDARNKIMKYDDERFDVVYSCAALSHVLGNSEELFDHMARVSKDVIITGEHEMIERIPPSVIPLDKREEYLSSNSHDIQPRDYKTKFKDRGFQNIETIDGWEDTKKGKSAYEISLGGKGHATVRVFKK
jgi:SAM-dependent methyltransferase